MLRIIHKPKEKKIVMVYDSHVFNLYDIGVTTVELFGRVKYALENNLDLSLEEDS